MGRLIYYCAGADVNSLPAPKIDALLFNALDHGATARKIAAAKEMCRRAKPNHVILDSSGFQVLMAEEKGKSVSFDSRQSMKNTPKFLNISPQHVMQVALIHQPRTVIGLDLPVRKLKGENQQQLEFTKKRPVNARWAYESFYWKNALIPHAEYLQPIQCYTLDHLEVFLKDISGINFDGVSMPVRNLNPAALALFMVSFYQRGIRTVHLLGTSNFWAIALSAYMARHMFDLISLDSTTWRLAADKAGLINPWDLSRTDLRPSIHIPDEVTYNCHCPSCQGLNVGSVQRMVPRKAKVDLLRRHNWWAIESVVADLGTNSLDLIHLEKALRVRSQNSRKIDDLIRILSLVEAFKNTDIAMLRMLLPPTPIKAKRSLSARISTSATSRVRKSARAHGQSTGTSWQSTESFGQAVSASNVPLNAEQNQKVSQEVGDHV